MADALKWLCIELAILVCQSACKSGSDSFLMKNDGGLARISIRESAPWHSSLVASGLVVESVIESEDMIKVTARSHAGEALCPSCGSSSRQVHSRYIRQVADLPCTGRRVALSLIARR
jgi:hypothetical protein